MSIALRFLSAPTSDLELFSSILGDVANHFGITRDEVIERIFGKGR